MLYEAYDDKFRDECAVFGVVTDEMYASDLALVGNLEQQHRGQEASGIATWTAAGSIVVAKGIGLVPEALKEPLTPGYMALGHDRYGTVEVEYPLLAAQPYCIETSHGPLAAIHNGNLSNIDELSTREEFTEYQLDLAATDSEAMLWLVAGEQDRLGDFHKGLSSALSQCRGAFSSIFMNDLGVHGIRDPWGIRPLWLGIQEDGFHTLASEQAALVETGALPIRELYPGELLTIAPDGSIDSWPEFLEPQNQATCSFEHVYLARPDGVINGRHVGETRRQMGWAQAMELPLPGDIQDYVVVPVVSSGTMFAVGFSEASGIQLVDGLEINEGSVRTFIAPGDHQARIRRKFTVNRNVVAGKKVVLADDSNVRGNTGTVLAAMMYEAGASEVHLRSSSPSIVGSCNMGVYTPDPVELIAARLNGSVAAIAREIGVDSVGYLKLETFKRLLGSKACYGCMDKRYPIDTPVNMSPRTSG